MKIRELLKLLKEDGWYQVSQTGSHRHFKHPFKPGKVTVPGKPAETPPPKTEKSIMRQAGL